MKDEEKKILSPADAAKLKADFDPDSDLPPDADAEERFNDFWKKNGVFIFGTIAAIALVITGIQGYEYLQERGEKKAQAAFAEAITTAEKLEFIDEHSSHPLAGLAYLEIADEDYQRGEFLQAANHYEAAIGPLTEAQSPVAARARLGAAMAKLRQGDDSGAALLEDLARDPEATEMMRAQAAYQHAVAMWQEGDFDAVRRSLDLLDSFSDAPDWQASGVRLASQIPELQELEEESFALE